MPPRKKLVGQRLLCPGRSLPHCLRIAMREMRTRNRWWRNDIIVVIVRRSKSDSSQSLTFSTSCFLSLPFSLHQKPKGSVFKTPNEVYPGLVTGKSSNGSNLYVRFDEEEDTRTYFFPKNEVGKWVAAADAAGMNDRESESEESDDFEIDLGGPSPDAPKTGAGRAAAGGRRGGGSGGGGGKATAAPKKGFFPGHSSASLQRTASLNQLAGRGMSGKGSSRSAATAAKKQQQQKTKKKSSSPSTSWGLLVPLLATLMALAAFAVSWLVLQRVPEPQRLLRFRVPW